jgi:histidine triad (HIT) family protein
MKKKVWRAQVIEDCVFCRIVKGTVPESMVYADEKVLAFMDIQPVNPGHVLIIPKVHASRLMDLDEETGAYLFKVGMRIAGAVKRSGVKCEGVNLLLSDGRAAFQEIFHVHLHVIPRFEGDNLRISFGRKYSLRPERSELDKMAGRIHDCLR